MPNISLHLLHRTAEILEDGGIRGFADAVQLAGFHTAAAMLVISLRAKHSSLESVPSGSDVIGSELETEVQRILLEELEFEEYVKALIKGYGAFYEDQLYALSNFSAFVVNFGPYCGRTSEHIYQAMKFVPNDRDTNAQERHCIDLILSAGSPDEAKKIAHQSNFEQYIREDWKDAQIPVMREVITVKHDQHEYVQKTLQRSKGLILVEDSPKDAFFGRGSDWTGKNMLGELWMELRMDRYGY